MGYTIQCSKCGHQNVLGRIFCTNCGQKLDFNQVDAKPRRTGGMSAGKVLRITITLVILAVIVMVLKPSKPLGEPGTLQDAQRMNQKLRMVKAAILDNKPVTQEVPEKEVNGYLAEILKRTAESAAKGEKTAVKMKQINVHFGDNKIHVLMLVEFGPMPLSYTIVGPPARKEHQFTIKAESVRLGLLPVPSAAGNWIVGRMATVFSKLANEKAILDQVSNMQIGDGQVVVAFQGAQ